MPRSLIPRTRRQGDRSSIITLPAQHRLAGGGGFVDAADAGGMRRGFDEFRIFLRLLRNGQHGFDERVEFSWLSVSVGSIMIAPGTISGNETVGG